MSEQPRRVDRRGPLTFLAAVGAGFVLVLALAAGGVFDGGRAVDEDAWRAAVEEGIGPVGDWEAYRDVWVEQVCGSDEAAFAWFVATGLEHGANADHLATNVEYACPERSELLERLRVAVTGVQGACGQPPRRRTDEDELLAEALGC